VRWSAATAPVYRSSILIAGRVPGTASLSPDLPASSNGSPAMAETDHDDDRRGYDLDAFFERARAAEQAMLVARGLDIKPRRSHVAVATGNALSGTAGDVDAMLEIIPNDDLHWKSWHRIVMATHASTGGSEEGRALAHEWSKKSKKYDEGYTDQVWDDLTRSPPDRIGFGTLFHDARQVDPNFRKPSEVALDARRRSGRTRTASGSFGRDCN
jgi:hypothetical protein